MNNALPEAEVVRLLRALVDSKGRTQVVIGSLNGVPSRFLIVSEADFMAARAYLADEPAP